MKAAKKRQIEAMKKHQQHMRYIAKRNAVNAVLYRKHEWPFDWNPVMSSETPSRYEIINRKFSP